MFRKSKKIHFIGIGGIGMSGIAEILINLGFEVSGSDLHESEQTKILQKLKAKIYIGHYPSNIGDYNVVVTSSAIDKNNAEIIEARKRKIPIIHRSEMLAELVRLKHGIGVAGTHGKTTTSSMLAHMLTHGKMNPTAIIGGKVHNFGSNACIGEGDYIVFEADESDGTFLKLLPTIAIVTNIDADHLDHYKYFNNIKSAFLKFINRIPFYGYSALCIDDATIREILPLVERPYITYGFSEDADVRAVNIRLEDGLMKFDCYISKEHFGEISITSPGNHNVQNSLSVIAVAKELGLDYDTIKEGFRTFKGVGRRFEKIDEVNDILIMDDYGHHPTEIRATLDALKNFGRRLVVVFQPHRYSRTQLLWDEFGQSFSNADEILLAEIYPAGETPIEGVSSSLIAESIFKHEKRKVETVLRFEDICDKVLSIAKSGDIIITLGAGDIYKAARRIAEKLRNVN